MLLAKFIQESFTLGQVLLDQATLYKVICYLCSRRQKKNTSVSSLVCTLTNTRLVILCFTNSLSGCLYLVPILLNWIMWARKIFI